MLYKLLILLAVVSCIYASSCPNCGKPRCEQKYCAEGTTHIGCIPKIVFMRQCGVGEHRYLHVDGTLRQQILQYVNVFRNRVASGLFNMSAAARMPTMAWDMELAYGAKVLAHYCDRQGKLCSNTEKYKYVATVELSGTLKNFLTLADDLINIFLPNWFADIEGCRMDAENHIHPTAEGTCVGHYIPLIQDKGDRMGCAVRMTANLNPDGVSSATMVCNFARANVNGMPHYVVGSVPGKLCESGRNRLYEFLCHPHEEVDHNYVQPIVAKPGCAQH